MSAPVQKKFREEFEGKETRSKSSCFGFMKGRKVRVLETDTHQSPIWNKNAICRSKTTEDIRKLGEFKDDNRRTA